MINIRTEEDSIGLINISSNQLWGSQTQRALKNFNISNEKIPYELILSLAKIKKVAAMVNSDLGLLKKSISKAIVDAADEILSGMHDKEFPLTIWQSGSGTQSNMNMNEVLANRASEILGGERGNNRLVHPNDDVNKSQSSNDVFLTAMHISAVAAIKNNLLPAILKLKKILSRKSISFKNVVKVGRTHLQDAVPLTLGQEISGWVSMLDHNIKHIKKSIFHLYELPLGGTAVGTGLNACPEYSDRAVRMLAELTDYPFISSLNKFESLSTCDALVHSHSSIKGLAVSMTKIANDIRWLSSGPRCGIGEINIPANEPGSSIMPGKINPTQCEVIMMICCQIIGNDMSISIGGSSGNFELNVYRPIIIYNFLQSVRILSDGINSFSRYCAVGITPNYNRINQLLNESLMLVTVLNSHIGYDKAEKIVKHAYKFGITLKKSAIQLGYVTEEQFDNLVQPINMISNVDNTKSILSKNK